MPPSVGLRLRQELPKDFTLRTGEDYIASEKEMKQFAPKRSALKVSKDTSDCKLPWTSEEFLDKDQDQITEPNWMQLSWVPVAVAAIAAAALAWAWRRRMGSATARGPLLETEAAA